MDNIDIMKRAKQYIESLANGIDPLTGNELPDSDIVNNVRISRCLFYTADVLQKVIDNGGEVQREKLKRSERAEFSLTDEQALALSPENNSISLSRTVGIINARIDDTLMKKLPRKAVTGWLLEKGLLKTIIINGRERTNPTNEGEQLGMTLQDYTTPTGNQIKICVYSPEAQQFIFDNIDAIIAFAAEEKAEKKRLAAEDDDE